MIGLLAVAVLVVIYDLAGSGTSSAAPPTATTTTAASKKTSQLQAEDNSLDPRFRRDILAASQNKKYEEGRNIFRMEELKLETAIANPRGSRGPYTVEPPPTPTPTPPPPPIPLKFYGFANKPNEPKRVFLADADEVFVAKQGDIVERKYKVVQINNASVVIEDMLYNNRQNIQLTAR